MTSQWRQIRIDFVGSKYLSKIWCVLYYRRDHTFDVKTCFQQNRYVFDVIVTSWALFVFCISWNFARDISTVFEEIKHLRIINNWGLMKQNYFGWSGVYFIFMLYNCYVPTYHRFLRQTLLLKHQNAWNFARDISTVFEEIKHLRSRAPENILPDY
jgi:hypothetical protein